ncbi:SGNH/GDSL hydrolase family protein [Alkalihalobacillus sp. 1P02AB]|uniref:SGNH/GDSL hydrolase family protein n=1 Tax=Alkalihalobacillus sp. 1P02AB TaxID=3132260 RepID=UPI0039A49CE3
MFVTIGDSLTEGIGDHTEDLSCRSWVEHFVEKHTEPLPFQNLAKRGLNSTEIRRTQLKEALSLNPTIVSLIAGANDILKGGWNTNRFSENFSGMVESFVEAGADIIVAKLPDFTKRLSLANAKKVIVQSQLKEANQIIEDLSEKHRLCLIDFWNHPMAVNDSMWSEDHVHPNALGYQEVANVIYHTYYQHKQNA